jgi:hypothetical protein
MKMKKFLSAAISLCLALFIVLGLCSCGYSNEIVPCENIVKAITDSEIGLPAGKIYSASAGEGESGYIPDSLLNSLFGGGGKISLFDSWIDYSFFMPSLAHPCEIVVILCDTPENAKDTARLLCRRLNTIKSVKGDKDSATPYSSAPQKKTAPNNANGSPSTVLPDYSAYLDGAEVTISRNYVLLIISSDTAAAKKTALALIG